MKQSVFSWAFLILSLFLCLSCRTNPKPASRLDSLPDNAAEEVLFGIADLHSHPFADEAFGGAFFAGKAFSRLGPQDALASCHGAHGPQGLTDLIGNGIDGVALHDTGGYPAFKGWPRWSESNHQQMYYSWLERAWKGGLRLLVAHAVNSEALCAAMRKKKGYDCDDMKAVDRQIAAACDLEKWIDEQSGGPGRGWLRIVTSSAQAREAIRAGKLAMVLGIEVDSLFGCRLGSDCDEAKFRGALNDYWDRGVRHIIPIHVTDNDLGGAALYTDIVFNMANKRQGGRFFDIGTCDNPGFTYREGGVNAAGGNAFLEKLLPFVPAIKVPAPHCNRKSLSPLGIFAIQTMLKKGMLLDVDHMSSHTIHAVLDIAEKSKVPLLSGHTGFIEISAAGQKRSEAQRTEAQLKRIVALGGMVGPILSQGKAQSEILKFSAVENDCDASAKTFAQAYLYALSIFRKEGVKPALSFGSDFNGLVHMPAPRFGGDACAGNKKQAALQKEPLAYPYQSKWVAEKFDRYKFGERTYDYNTDGLSHVGLLPDFIQDLSNIGVSDEDLKPLFHSADAYVKVWERMEKYSLEE